jgi:hypothetical protein
MALERKILYRNPIRRLIIPAVVRMAVPRIMGLIFLFGFIRHAPFGMESVIRQFM